MPRSIRKLTTWIALVAYVLSSISPAERLVLCLEPEGRVLLEAVQPSGCTPCDQENLPVRLMDFPADSCCPCTDIPLPCQVKDAQAKLGAANFCVSLDMVVQLRLAVASLRSEQADFQFSARGPPRPAQRFALDKTVILRV